MIELDVTHPKLHSHTAHGNERAPVERVPLQCIMHFSLPAHLVA